MSNLVIVESPAKAKTIKKYLGNGYEVVASMGHVRDLPKSKLGVDVETRLSSRNTVDIKGKEELIKTLKEAGEKERQGLSGHRPGPGRRGHFLASGAYPGAGCQRARTG